MFMDSGGFRTARGRILLLSTNMGSAGGAEEQVMYLALQLRRRGWEVRIVSMLHPQPLPPELAAAGIRVLSLGMRPGYPDPRAIARLISILREFRPQVLHSHMTHANLLARVTRLFHSVPVLICTLHGMKMFGVYSDFTALRELAHRITDPLADMTTSICHAASAYYEESKAVPAGKMMTITNGLDVVAWRPSLEARRRLRAEWGGEERFTWAAAGRIERVKNYPLMLRAFATAKTSPDSLLVIAGSGSLLDFCRDEATRLGVAERVRFLGRRQDMRDVLSAADGFLLSSDSEGLPMVLLQASACGLPIVATSVGGNAEVVINGRTGFLCPPGDAPALARAIDTVVELDPGDRIRMGAAGREHTSKTFDTRAVLDRWESLYFELLERSAEEAPPDQRQLSVR